MTCEEFKDLSGAYALDAITPAERQAVEAHLATCPKCTSLARELRGIVSVLPLSVLQVTPPPELKERILAAIREESQRTSGSRTQARPPIPLTQARHQRRSLRILIAVAALIFALLGGLTAWNISLQSECAQLSRTRLSYGGNWSAFLLCKTKYYSTAYPWFATAPGFPCLSRLADTYKRRYIDQWI